ncbi:partial Diguanylate cyclase DosC, partial [Anaerolineae bacterium]
RKQLRRETNENKKAQAELDEMAIRDTLTGLFGHRHFMSLLEQEIEQAIRYEHDLSILVMELDKFKPIVTRHGRASGDQVLEAVAEIIRDNIRAGDAASRAGVGEFTVLFPEANVERAAQIAERIRADVAKFPIPTARGTADITLSAGVAQLPKQGEATLETLVARAQSVLRAAKRAGGNQVVIWDERAE